MGCQPPHGSSPKQIDEPVGLADHVLPLVGLERPADLFDFELIDELQLGLGLQPLVDGQAEESYWRPPSASLMMEKADPTVLFI